MAVALRAPDEASMAGAHGGAADPQRALGAPALFRWRACTAVAALDTGSGEGRVTVSMTGSPDVSGTVPLVVACDAALRADGGQLVGTASGLAAVAVEPAGGRGGGGAEARLLARISGLGHCSVRFSLRCTPRLDVAADVAGDRRLGWDAEGTGAGAGAGGWLGGDEEAAAAGDEGAKSRLADLALLGRGEDAGMAGASGRRGVGRGAPRFGRRAGAGAARPRKLAGGGGGLAAFSTGQDAQLSAMREAGRLSASEAGPMGDVQAGLALALGSGPTVNSGVPPVVWLE